MGEKLTNSIVSALIGGIVGAAFVFIVAGKTKFDSLEVGNLKITKAATFFSAEGKEDVVIREGSVLANNVVLGKKFIGTQYQGHVFVGNRIFTSPDDLMVTPMENWRFFTELGSTEKAGGEMIVRSASGANVVNQPVQSGMMLRAGFDEQNELQLFARNNSSGVMMPAVFHRPQVAQTPSPEVLAAKLAETSAAPAVAEPKTEGKPQTASAATDPVK